MHLARLAAIILLAALALTPAAQPSTRAQSQAAAAPKNLHAFLLRVDEAETHSFSRTPSFAWAPVRGALCYEFELATSRAFNENAIVWSNVKYGVDAPATPATGIAPGTPAPAAAPKGQCDADATPVSATAPARTLLRSPAVSIDVALPWMTGIPYALYARVRGVTRGGPTPWSKSFDFNMRWPTLPQSQTAPVGLMRWSQVEGATGYQVWLLDAGKVFSTTTNVADTREHYAFHQTPAWTSTVRWRVRAVRQLFGDIPNGLPAVSYGPWSAIETTLNPAFVTGPMTLAVAVSDKQSDGGTQAAHELMPGFAFSGNANLAGATGDLYRVYISTDSDCVNIVYKGAAVGGPGYAPRSSGPLQLPRSSIEMAQAVVSYLKDGKEGDAVFAVDGAVVKTNEGITSTSSGSGATGTSADPSQTVALANVDLPDTDFPNTRYFWTVVPVSAVYNPVTQSYTYYDIDLPQDACAAGRVFTFGKQSEPVVTGAGAPYVSGLSPTGRLLTSVVARPSVYGTPLVAWKPAVGAHKYEVQWSKRAYPWKAVGSKETFATSALLDVKPGTWNYRVRGLNYALAKKPQMSWSAPVAFVAARPKFQIVKK